MFVQTNQLEALVWVARLGSFRSAASQLGVTQPTVSMRILELERLLDIRLFDRSSHRALLTEKGRELVRYAERIVALAEEMQMRATPRRHLEGPIRLGAADTFALTCLPTLLSMLEQLFPGLRVDVQVDYSFNLNQRLQRGQLDIAFLTGPAQTPEIRVEPLVTLPLAWVVSPRLGLPDRVLRPNDLRGWPILTNPRPSHLYTTVRDWFGADGRQPDRITTCNSLTIMARLAAGGFGVALLPTGILRHEFETGALRVCRTRPAVPAHEMLVAFRGDTAEAVVRAIRETALQLIKASDLVRG